MKDRLRRIPSLKGPYIEIHTKALPRARRALLPCGIVQARGRRCDKCRLAEGQNAALRPAQGHDRKPLRPDKPLGAIDTSPTIKHQIQDATHDKRRVPRRR